MNHTLLDSVPALRAIVEATLDANIFNQEDFRNACRPTWYTFLPVIENRLPDVTQTSYPGWQNAVAVMKKSLVEGGRGTWCLVRKRTTEGKEYYLAMIHDGGGQIHARSDGWTGVPTFDATVDRLVSYEIYRLRRAVEEERRRVVDVKVLNSMNLRIGDRLKNVRVGLRVYSSAEVKETDPQSGTVTLEVSKRGSPYRWSYILSASDLAN